MEIITAKSAGFCFGVERAMQMVYDEIEKGGDIYTYGPIIHNEEVVRDLEEKGVRMVNSPEEIAALKGGTIITRSHGVDRKTDELIRSGAARCVDATCPFVKRIHQIVEKESAAGSRIVVIGSAGHPEVMGIVGWSSTPVTVIATEEEARAFTCDPEQKVCVVSQTTFNANKFEYLVALLKEKGYNLLCVNTICNATHERQSEAKDIAARADIMIVIGGKSSSNSAKLYEICREVCPKTFFVQTWKDLHLTLTGGEKVIGITAGASTPKNIIEEVQNHVRADRADI